VPSAGALASIAILGVVCTAVAFVLFSALIAEIGPVRATVVTYINPAVASALGVLVLNESFTVWMAIGLALVILGSTLATRGAATRSTDASPAVRDGRPLETAPGGIGRSESSG
jgi:drug/metabolite transporter (DMT)-like permease